MGRFMDFRMGYARYMVIASLVVIWFIIYLTRTNISVLLVDTRFLSDMGLLGKSSIQGFLMTAFLMPYALANVLLSPLGDKIGPRKAMIAGVIITATGTLAGGLVPTLTLLLASRVWMGLGQGIHYPNQSIFIKNWFAPKERGMANALLAVGACMAPLLAMPLFTWLIRIYGWESTFIVLGIGIIIAALPLFMGIITDSPANNRYVRASEKEFVVQQELQYKDMEIAVQGAASSIIKTLDFWLITTAYLAYLAIWWGLLTWLPQYLMVARGFSIQSLGWVSSLPYAFAVVAALCGGILSDRMGKRALFCLIALGGAALCIGIGAVVNSAYLCAFLIALGVGLDVVCYPVSWALLQSKLPADLIGTGSGMMNGISNLGSALTPFAMGMLIDKTGFYESGMYMLASFGILGAACCFWLVKRGM